MRVELLRKTSVSGANVGRSWYVSLFTTGHSVDEIIKLKQSRQKKIAFFGIGKESLFYYWVLHEAGIIPDELTSNSKKDELVYFDNIPVVSSESLISNYEQYYIIITIENVEFVNQVRKQLMHSGVKDFGIVAHDFLCDFDRTTNKKLIKSFLNVFNEICEIKDFSHTNFNDARWLFTHSISMWINSVDSMISRYEGKEKLCLLDVGPGAGLESLVYQDLLRCSLDWITLENPHEVYRVSNLEKLIQKYAINIQYGHIETDNFPNAEYDIILFTEILEHLVYNPINTLKKLYDMLKSDGCLVLTTPKKREASVGYLKTWRSLPDINEKTIKRNMEMLGISGQSHVYEYTSEEVREVLALAGFKIIESCSDIRIEYICMKAD